MPLTLEEKKAKLNEMIKDLDKQREKVNPGSYKNIFWAGTEPTFSKLEFLPTGNPSLDRALGGGYRKGVGTEIMGAPGSGKSVLACMACDECIKEGGIPLYISTESAQEPTEQRRMAGMSDEAWAQVLYVYANGSGEEIFNRLRDTMWDSKKGVPQHLFDLIVIDSLAQLLPADELKSIHTSKEGFASHTMGRHAAMVGKFYRFMGALMSPKCVLLTINQVRSSMEQWKPDEGTGGFAPKFANKVRISLGIAGKSAGPEVYIDEGKTKIGNKINFNVIKNNAGGGKPYASGDYIYYFGKGLDMVTPLVEEALELGIIWKDGPTSRTHRFIKSDGSEEKVIGLKPTDTSPGVITFFKENTEELNYLKQQVSIARRAEVVDESESVVNIKDEITEVFGDVDETSDEFKKAEEILASEVDLKESEFTEE